MTTYLDINELDKSEAPAGHRHLVFDEDDTLHALRALLPGAGRQLHSLRDRLRTRQRVQPAKEQHGGLGVANVPCAVVRVQRAPAPRRARALRVVDLDAPTVVLLAGIEGFLEGGARGGAV